MSTELAVILSSVVTVVWFVTFVALWLWAWSRRRRADFDAAARLPLDDLGDAGNGRQGGR
jgi:cytochrome c oxidase cbb3-type subunit IV